MNLNPVINLLNNQQYIQAYDALKPLLDEPSLIDAVIVWKRLHDLDPENIPNVTDEYWVRGEQYYSRWSKDLWEAQTGAITVNAPIDLRAKLTIPIDSAPALQLVGLAAKSRLNPQLAPDVISQLNDSEVANYLKSSWEMENKNYDQAAKTLNSTSSVIGYILKGRNQYLSDNPRGAWDSLQKIFQIKTDVVPENYQELLIIYGFIYNKLGEPENAIKSWSNLPENIRPRIEDEYPGALFGSTVKNTLNIDAANEIIAKLDAHIGLESVKTQIRKLSANAQLRLKRELQGLPNQPTPKHLAFIGSPGTGKTTIAAIVAQIYYHYGLLPAPTVVEVSRKDLVEEHLGGTAQKTQKMIDKAMGGVLFIDEAYSLATEGLQGGDAFGTEATETIMKAMEDHRDKLVVIVAGYKDKMDRFFSINEGMKSRIPRTIEFHDYTPEELTEIAQAMSTQKQYKITSEASDYLLKYLTTMQQNGSLTTIANARGIRELIDEARESEMALRLLEVENPTHEQLTTIVQEDISNAIQTLGWSR